MDQEGAKKINFNEIPASLSDQYFKDLIIKYLLPSEPFHIKTVDIKSALGPGENFVSKIFRIKVSLDRPTKDGRTYFSFIAKRVGSEFFNGEVLNKMCVYVKEVDMYEQIIPSFEKIWKDAGEVVCFGPRMFSKIVQPDQILIFEDLCDDRFEMGNRLDRLNLDQVHLVIEKLAKFHAASVIHLLKNGDYKQHFTYGIYNEKLNEEFVTYFNQYTVSFVDTMEDKNFAKNYIESLVSYLTNILKLYNFTILIIFPEVVEKSVMECQL